MDIVGCGHFNVFLSFFSTKKRSVSLYEINSTFINNNNNNLNNIIKFFLVIYSKSNNLDQYYPNRQTLNCAFKNKNYIFHFFIKHLFVILKITRLVSLFEQQFSHFKHTNTYFYTFSPTRISKNYKNLISNYYTKQPLSFQNVHSKIAIFFNHTF